MGNRIVANELNVVEMAKRLDPKNNVATIMELCNKKCDLLADAVATESNDLRSHVSHVRTSLPDVGIRMINEGTEKSSSSVEPTRHDIMLIESNPEIDEELIDGSGDPAKAMSSEIIPYTEAMMQYFVSCVLYGGMSERRGEIPGFAKMYDNSAMDNVISLGGTNDLTSIYIVEWDERLCKLLYPKSHPTIGVKYTDFGLRKCTDANNRIFMGYGHQVKMKFGMAVDDDDCVQRICDIDSMGLGIGDEAAKAHHKLITAKNLLPNMGAGAAIYCNRQTKTQFDIFAIDKSNGFYYMKDITGAPVTSFQGTPIRMLDGLMNTESRVQ